MIGGSGTGYKTDKLSSHPDAHDIKVLIVEVSYSSELRYKEQLHTKVDQHKRLMQDVGTNARFYIEFWELQGASSILN